MTEQQKPQSTPLQQTQQQLQGLLRETIKENKSLQNKNAKLQGKYVEVFKENKLIKKDNSTFVSFLSKYFSNDSGTDFQEMPPGQYQLVQIERIAEQKQTVYKNRIQYLEKINQAINKERVSQVEEAVLKKKLEIIGDYEQRTKGFKEQINKEIHGYLKELQALKKTNKIQAQQITQLKSSLQSKTNELSKMGKEKLKLEHHLNNLRKKQIAEELSDDKQKKQEQLMNERHEFLSLRQQVESLLTKRDQLKRELKEKEDELVQSRRINLFLEGQIQKLKQQSRLQDQKYQLVRECSLEQLENLILSHHSQSASTISKPKSQQKPKENIFKMSKKQEPIIDQQQEIQRQYLKNVLLRYIKAEVSGSFDQALTLLEIIGTILKLDPESVQALNSYKNKRRQWWYIKY